MWISLHLFHIYTYMYSISFFHPSATEHGVFVLSPTNYSGP